MSRPSPQHSIFLLKILTLTLLSLHPQMTGGATLSNQPQTPQTAPQHTKGNPNSMVKLEMFSDFQSSDCKLDWSVLLQVLAYFNDSQFFFVFHPFALWTTHRQVADVTFASEIISKHLSQEGYWDLVTFLFNNNNNFSDDAFYNKTRADLYVLLKSYANYFNVSDSTFDNETQSQDLQLSINNNLLYGNSKGITFVPAYLLNGEILPIMGNATLTYFIQVIEAARETTPESPTVEQEPAPENCERYWVPMLAFILISIALFIILIITCMSSCFQSLKRDLFDPAKLWETVTLPDETTTQREESNSK